MGFPFTKETIISSLLKGVEQNTFIETVTGIKTKKHNVGDLVEVLEPVLCAKETDIRIMGTQFLIDILNELNSDQLNNKEVEVIWRFLIDRLNDHHSITPMLLSGALVLCRNQPISYKNLASFLVKLFKCIVCQTQKREDRKKIFELLKIASETETEEFRQLGVDWIYGVINSIEGERDPRNLVFIFMFMPNFVKNYLLYHLSDEMFEVFAVYFPVDFTPAQSDNLTRDLLAGYLEECLCASMDFLHNCMELLMEKISSDLISAKKDCLNLIIKWSKVCSAEKLEPYFQKLWEAIQRHIIPEQSEELKDLKAKTINNLICKLSEDDVIFFKIINIIFSETIPAISDVNSEMFEYEFRKITCCAESSIRSSIYIAEKVIPLLISQYDNESMFVRVRIMNSLKIMCNILDEFDSVQKINFDSSELIKITIMRALTQEIDVRVLESALETVKNIVKFLSKDNRLVLYSKLIEITANKNFIFVHPGINHVICKFHEHFEEEINILVIDPLKTLVKSSGNMTVIKLLLKYLDVKFLKFDIFCFFVEFILSDSGKINVIQQQSLTFLVEELLSNKDFELSSYHTVVEKIIQFLQTYPDQTLEVFVETKKLIEILMEKLDTETQKDMIFKFMPLLHTKTCDYYLLAGILGKMNHHINLGDQFLNQVDKLVQVSISTENKDLQMLCNKLLCSLFNKCCDAELKIIHNLQVEVKKNSKTAVEVYSWIAKGLIMRGNHDFAELIDCLIQLLDHQSSADLAILSFNIIIEEVSDVDLPISKYLCKQKMFNYLLKKLKSRLDEFSENHIVALIVILKGLPWIVLKINLQSIGPFLLKALSINNTSCILSSVLILNQFLSEQNEYFNTYTPTVVEKLLKLTKFNANMNIRIQALECLYNLTILPVYYILPFKNEVILQTASLLDDPKRLVRNAAVKTRLKWYLIGTTEE
uniref:MMS19 nucleotide excision repair protein n=1 Tax=Culicoides sonorensis TaxID=179676 RepID=A0A336M2E3_CULSO